MIDVTESSLRKSNRVNINSSLEIPGFETPIMDREEHSDHSTRGKERISRAFLASVVAAQAAFIFGYTMGYTSPTQKALEREIMSKSQFAWFASLIAIGAIIGSIIGAVLIEKIGRKASIMSTSLLYTPGWCLICYGRSAEILYAGRFLTGIAVGISSLSVPVYIAEVASARLRGGLGSLNQLAVTFGLFVAYLVGAVLSWEWTAVVPIMFCALMVLTMAFMPETPRWLLANNQRHKALQDLAWLRGPEYDAEEECFEIESNLDQQEKLSFKDLKDPSIYRPLFIGVMMMVFQQLCGINAVIFYCSKIFDSAGLHEANSVSLAVAGTQIVFTSIACLIVDKSGRRILLMIGGMIMFVCLFLLGVYYDIADIKDVTRISIFGKYSHSILPKDISWLAVLSVIVYIAFFSIGWGPLPWLLMSEIFPPRVKGIASGAVTLVNWSFAFLVTSLFHKMTLTLHEQGTFWFFASWSLLSFLFTLFVLPETKGRTLEQIEKIFRGERNR